MTNPGAELKAATDVRAFGQQGIETYLPRYFDDKTRTRRLLLPGYLFVVSRSMRTPIEWLAGCDGIQEVIWQERRARRKLFNQLQILRKLENKHGLIVLPGQSPTRYTFINGDPVKVRGKGPLAGKTGKFVHYGARDRVKALLDDIFGRQTPVWLKAKDIQAVTATA
jgi:transcription antitermination factor NusG